VTGEGEDDGKIVADGPQIFVPGQLLGRFMGTGIVVAISARY